MPDFTFALSWMKDMCVWFVPASLASSVMKWGDRDVPVHPPGNWWWSLGNELLNSFNASCKSRGSPKLPVRFQSCCITFKAEKVIQFHLFIEQRCNTDPEKFKTVSANIILGKMSAWSISIYQTLPEFWRSRNLRMRETSFQKSFFTC